MHAFPFHIYWEVGTILKIMIGFPNLITLIDYIEKPLINSQKKKKKINHI